MKPLLHRRPIEPLLFACLIAAGAGCIGTESANDAAPDAALAAAPDDRTCSPETWSGTCAPGGACFRGVCLTPDTRYSETEVVPQQLLGLYGRWTFVGYTGWTEGPPDFDELRVQPFGVFECIKNGVSVLNGRVEFYDARGSLAVRLVPDQGFAEDSWPLVVYASMRQPPQLMALADGDSKLRIWGAVAVDAPLYRFVRAGTN